MEPGDIFLHTTVVKHHELQSMGAGKFEGKSFRFTARSISSNEICEPMMKIMLQQVGNMPLLFRHRHPAGNDDKVVPIFGRSTGGRIEKEKDLTYLVLDYNVQLSTEDGHELLEKQVFAEWVKESNEAGNPIGISLAFIQHLEDGIAYWVDLYEASGTHVPACKSCRHKNELEKGGSIVPDDGKDKPDEQKKRYEILEGQLEKMTKEKSELEGKLGAAETSRRAALDEAEKQKLENGKFKEETVKLATTLKALENRLDYAETKKPLVDAVLKHEKRTELEGFYKGQTVEYLQGVLKKFESDANSPSISEGNSPVAKLMEDMKKKKLEFTIKPEDALAKVSPELRAAMKKWYEDQGITVTEAKK